MSVCLPVDVVTPSPPVVGPLGFVNALVSLPPTGPAVRRQEGSVRDRLDHLSWEPVRHGLVWTLYPSSTESLVTAGPPVVPVR